MKLALLTLGDKEMKIIPSLKITSDNSEYCQVSYKFTDELPETNDFIYLHSINDRDSFNFAIVADGVNDEIQKRNKQLKMFVDRIYNFQLVASLTN